MMRQFLLGGGVKVRLEAGSVASDTVKARMTGIPGVTKTWVMGSVNVKGVGKPGGVCCVVTLLQQRPADVEIRGIDVELDADEDARTQARFGSSAA